VRSFVLGFLLTAFAASAADVPERVPDRRLVPSALTPPPMLPLQDVPEEETPFFQRWYVWAIAVTINIGWTALFIGLAIDSIFGHIPQPGRAG
jgi:hypothetical protein